MDVEILEWFGTGNSKSDWRFFDDFSNFLHEKIEVINANRRVYKYIYCNSSSVLIFRIENIPAIQVVLKYLLLY